MANVVSALNPEVWRAFLQPTLRKSLVAEAVADTTFAADLKHGDTIHYPYYSSLTVGNYSPGSTVSTTDLTATDEYLTVDQKKYVAFYVDDVESLQSRYDIVATWSDEAAYKLRDAIDTAVFAEVTAASADLDDGDIGGTDGSGISATTANVVKVFTTARKKLRTMNVEEAGDWVAVINSELAEVIEQTTIEKGFQIADATLRNGYVGNFLGFKVFASNNLATKTYGGKDCKVCYIGKAKQIHLAVQMPPAVKMKDVSDKAGQNIIILTVYGIKVFTQHKKRFLKTYIRIE